MYVLFCTTRDAVVKEYLWKSRARTYSTVYQVTCRGREVRSRMYYLLRPSIPPVHRNKEDYNRSPQVPGIHTRYQVISPRVSESSEKSTRVYKQNPLYISFVFSVSVNINNKWPLLEYSSMHILASWCVVFRIPYYSVLKRNFKQGKFKNHFLRLL